MFKSEIKIKKSLKNDLLSYKVDKCDFCNKVNLNYIYYHELQKKLSKNHFFCNFCLRNKFDCNKNIMIMTFNVLIKYYYNLYTDNQISYSQLISFIDSHKKTGLLHPAFYYDDDTFKWFVDFGKIGDSDNKVSFDTVVKNIINITFCFNPSENVKKFNVIKSYNKIHDYVYNFYKTRKTNKYNVLSVGGNNIEFNQDNMFMI